MDAIREIEAALAAGPTDGPWSLFKADDDTGWHLNQKGGPGFVATLPLMSHRKAECTANAEFMAACSPAAIREVLQTLASKEAELVRLRAALGFYADPERYHGPNQRVVRDHDPFTPEDAVYTQDVTRDGGAIARHALTQPPKEPT